MDPVTLQRIKLLHPAIRQEILQAYKYVNNTLFGKNIRLRFTHTYRSFKEQEELYNQGRLKLYNENGKPLSKVTNAKAGQSIHNYGLAFDIVILQDKNGDGIFETASWDINLMRIKMALPTGWGLHLILRSWVTYGVETGKISLIIRTLKKHLATHGNLCIKNTSMEMFFQKKLAARFING